MRETSIVWEYFTRLNESNEIICKLCQAKPCKNCNTHKPCKLSGIIASNGKKHLKYFHPEEYILVENKDKCATQKKRKADNKEDVTNFFKPRQLLSPNQYDTFHFTYILILNN